MKAVTEALPFELPADEELLWCIKKVPGIDICQGVLWIVSALLLTALCLLPNLLSDGRGYVCAGLLLIPTLILIWAAIQAYRRDRRIIYALSNRRAFIIEHPLNREGVPIVFSFAVRSGMVCVSRYHRNGNVDYYWGEERMGGIRHRVGFLNVPPELNPASHLTQIGIVLSPDKNGCPPYHIRRPKIAGVVGWKNLLGLSILAAVLFLAFDEARFYLMSRETTAIIESYQKRTEKRDKGRSEVVVFYPKVSFRLDNGEICQTVSKTGYESCPAYHTGSRISVRYHAANPHRVTIHDESALFLPGGIAFVLFCCLWVKWKNAAVDVFPVRVSCIFVEADRSEA